MKDKVCQFPEVSISKIVRQNLFLSVFKITKEFLKAFLLNSVRMPGLFHYNSNSSVSPPPYWPQKTYQKYQNI